MADSDGLIERALRGTHVNSITRDDRLTIRVSENLDELLAFRAFLRTAVAGRGRWTLWTWLLLLSGGTMTASTDAGGAVVIGFGVLVLALILIIGYVSRVRASAARADDWLSEVDFRLAQLAAKG